MTWAPARFYYYNSESTVLRFPDRLAMLRLRATAALEKGGEIYHGVQFTALDPAGLPGDAELRRVAAETASQLDALTRAPLGEAYTGPSARRGHRRRPVVRGGLRAGTRDHPHAGRRAGPQRARAGKRVGEADRLARSAGLDERARRFDPQGVERPPAGGLL